MATPTAAVAGKSEVSGTSSERITALAAASMRSLSSSSVSRPSVRQRGTKFRPGAGVGIGKDDTIFAKGPGIVQFREGRPGRVISVEPAATE